MNSSLKKIIIFVIIIVCLGFVLIPRFLGDDEEDMPAANTASEDTRLAVNAVIVEDAALDDNLRITGSLMANESIQLSSEVPGIVEKIYFKEGQKVKKGELLVQLDNDEIAAEIQKLEYTLKLNEDMEYRQKQLLEREAISQEEYETALTTLNTIRADLRLKQVQLSKRQIRAPFSGTIGLRKISEGSYVNTADIIAQLYSIDPIKINFSVPGKYTSQVNVGDKISFTVDAHNDQTFVGEVYAIEPEINQQTRNLQIRALSKNEKGLLFPGQFAKIQLTLETFEQALMIPSEAVIPELNGMKVFIYKNGIAETQAITTGIRTSREIQVLSGLNSGDTLIISGMMQLQSGMPVKIIL